MGHKPVMAAAVTDHLVWDRDGLYVDGTIGCANHARLILKELSEKGSLWGFDWDEEMLEKARVELAGEAERVRLFSEPFSCIGSRLQEAGKQAHGIFLDLGLNSAVLDSKERGFLYREADAPLDMRMDKRRTETAEQLLNETSERDLVQIFRELGEVRSARSAARAIVEARQKSRLTTAGDLVAALRKGGALRGGVSELSRLYQAVRLKINSELEDLDAFLESVADWLLPKGRLVVLTYESLSDRRVKSLQRSKREDGSNLFRSLVRRVLRPDRDEVRTNTRARSAKLRAMERMT